MSVVKVLRHGQITLPKTLREVLDIKEGDILEIELEKSHLVLKTKVLVDKEEVPRTGVLPGYSATVPGFEPEVQAHQRAGEGTV
jgi:AbrB family looped-hinge helix DNA binding protein